MPVAYIDIPTGVNDGASLPPQQRGTQTGGELFGVLPAGRSAHPVVASCTTSSHPSAITPSAGS